MVSTRSGRVISTEATSFGRNARSRARKEADAHQEDAAADVGQPEVTSPAPPVNYFASNDVMASPALFGGFGRPLPSHQTAGTPMQLDRSGTPLQERLVKTVGKSAAKTPSGRTASMAITSTSTPSANDVKQLAGVPLPDDAGTADSEPFASSEDEPAGPASPPKDLTGTVHAVTAGIQNARRVSTPLWFFTCSSLLGTAMIALLLSPCLDPGHLAVNSRTYVRVCKSLVLIRHDAIDRAQQLGVLVTERVDALRRELQQGLPPAALDAMEQAWGSVKQAHLAAWTVISPLVEKAKQHVGPTSERVGPLWDRAEPELRGVLRKLATHVIPLTEKALERIMSLHVPQRPAEPVPITCIDFRDLISLVDPDSVRPEYLQELWDQAARQVVTQQKAPMWLLTCKAEAVCIEAAAVLQKAATSFIYIDGSTYGSPDAAGQLQRELATFIRSYPDGLVLVTLPDQLHPNSLSVLVNAASESGHLQMDGRPVVCKRALFLLLAHYPADVEGSLAVKEWLGQSIFSRGADASQADAGRNSAVVMSFRRRVDAVLLLGRLSDASSVS